MYTRTIEVTAPEGRIDIRLEGSWQEGVRAFDTVEEIELLYAAGVLGPRGDRRYAIDIRPGVDAAMLSEILARLPYVMRMAEDGEPGNA